MKLNEIPPESCFEVSHGANVIKKHVKAMRSTLFILMSISISSNLDQCWAKMALVIIWKSG